MQYLEAMGKSALTGTGYTLVVCEVTRQCRVAENPRTRGSAYSREVDEHIRTARIGCHALSDAGYLEFGSGYLDPLQRFKVSANGHNLNFRAFAAPNGRLDRRAVPFYAVSAPFRGKVPISFYCYILDWYV